MSIITLQRPASILITVYDLRANLIKRKTSKEGHQHSIWEMKERLFFLKKTKLTFQKSSNDRRQKGKNNLKKSYFYHLFVNLLGYSFPGPVYHWPACVIVTLAHTPPHTGCQRLLMNRALVRESYSNSTDSRYMAQYLNYFPWIECLNKFGKYFRIKFIFKKKIASLERIQHNP